MFGIRSHLHWILGERVFHWTRKKTGRKILRLFKTRKILKNLVAIVRRDETIMNMYMEWDEDVYIMEKYGEIDLG